MKTSRLICAICIALLASGSAFGQSRFSVEVVGGESVNDLNGGYLSNWANGWTIGVGVGYEASPDITIHATLSFDRYPYRGGFSEPVLLSVTSSGYNVGGQPSTAEEASLGFRFKLPSHNVIPFLSLNAGIRNLITGEQRPVGWTSSIPAISSVNFFSAIGLGLAVPLNQSFAVSVEGSVRHVFGSNQNFVPLIAGVQFNL